MRITELLETYMDLEEGGKSGPVRYNSEVGMLVGFCGVDPGTFDPANPEASLTGAPLQDPAKIFAEIKKFLAPNFDQGIFEKWVQKGTQYLGPITERLGGANITFGWAGGTNKSSAGAADITFHGVQGASGVSIKAEGGITLANLTPKALGLTPAKGSDIFYHYAQTEYNEMKTQIFNAVFQAAQAAQQTPNQTLDPTGRGKYTITFDPDNQTYLCSGKKNYEGTAEDILAKINKNAKWQRVFGDWFQVNFAANKTMAEPLYTKLASAFEETIEAYLANNAQLTKILQFAEIPYFYASSTGLYFVPSVSAVSDIKVMGINYGRIGPDAEQPEGTSQLFTAEIGKDGSEKHAKLDIYIRYANGMFEANPTVRVQNLRDPNFMSWEKLI